MTDVIADAQGTSHAVRARFSTMTRTGLVVNVYETPGIILSGSVTYDRTREIRRNGTLSIVDKEGTLTPSAISDEVAPGNRIRIERGTSGAFMSLGTYTIIESSGSMDGRLDLRLEDVAYDLRQDFGDAVTIPQRTRASRALRTLWEPVLGDGSDWSLDDSSSALGGAQTYMDDDERLHVGAMLMNDLGLEVYIDREGIPVLTPIADPTTQVVAHTFRQARGEGRAVTLTRSSEVRPYNRQVVVGEHPDQPVVRGEAIITDAAHPYHPDRVGLRTAPVYRSARVATQWQANTLARSMLTERAWTDTVAWTGVPDITVDAGDIVRIIEPQTRTDARYRVDTVTLPIVTGAMRFSGTRVSPMFEED